MGLPPSPFPAPCEFERDLCDTLAASENGAAAMVSSASSAQIFSSYFSTEWSSGTTVYFGADSTSYENPVSETPLPSTNASMSTFPTSNSTDATATPVPTTPPSISFPTIPNTPTNYWSSIMDTNTTIGQSPWSPNTASESSAIVSTYVGDQTTTSATERSATIAVISSLPTKTPERTSARTSIAPSMHAVAPTGNSSDETNAGWKTKLDIGIATACILSLALFLLLLWWMRRMRTRRTTQATPFLLSENTHEATDHKRDRRARTVRQGEEIDDLPEYYLMSVIDISREAVHANATLARGASQSYRASSHASLEGRQSASTTDVLRWSWPGVPNSQAQRLSYAQGRLEYPRYTALGALDPQGQNPVTQYPRQSLDGGVRIAGGPPHIPEEDSDSEHDKDSERTLPPAYQIF